MSTVKNIYSIIDKAASFNTAMDFDNVGILVGDENKTVTKAIVALDITKKVIGEAENIGAELIISHHPIIFDPVKSVDVNSALYALIKSGISAICCHTNLDIAEDIGVNYSLAKALGLVNISKINDCLFTAETSDITYSPKEFAEHIKNKLHSEQVVFTDTEKEIHKVAFCSGSGGDFIFDAKNICDAYVTGEARHHELLFAAENNIPMFVAGHYETEKLFDKTLQKYLQDNICDAEFLLSHMETNPVKAI